MTIIRLLLLSLLAMPALAQTTIYYRNCDTGAHASCANGANGNAGTSQSAPKQSLPADTAINALAAGSSLRLCNGSAWVDGNFPFWLLRNTNATEASPITIEGWDCGDGASGRPILRASSGSSTGIIYGGFCWDTPNCPSPDHGGYVLRGVRLTKSGSLATGSTGLTFYGSARYLLIENNELDNWANVAEVQTGQNIRNLTVRNNYIHDNSQNGWLGSATDMLIEDNTFENNNNDGSALEHGIYSGGCEPQQRVTFRRNTFLNNSTSGGTCSSGNITTRGNVTGMTIEENYIEVPAGTADCYGISVIDGYASCTEHVDNLVIRGNTIVNVGSNSIAVRLCTNCLIENNRVIRDFTNTGLHYGISIADPGDSEDLAVSPATGATIRNNSIYVDRQGSGSGINVANGSGHKVLNNVVHFTANVGSANCFAHTALANFSVWDNNWCYELGSGQWSGAYSTLAAAQSAGFDAGGGNTDPLWASTPSAAAPTMATQSGSPLRNAGRNTDKAPRDAAWCQRDGTPDIGAMEANGTPCLTFRAPVELR